MTIPKKFGVEPPSTRYQGSKEKIAGWIWNSISDLRFDTFLDALGGTGCLGFRAKARGKEVTYNDVFRSNHQMGLSLIENDSTTLSDADVEFLLERHRSIEYRTFIQDTYRGIYYTDSENEWLDALIRNLKEITNLYRRAVALSALFQACLAKRPYNLFHRANLYMRTAEVERGFGNKPTWDRPFPEHFANFVKEYNSRVFSNGRENRALNSDVFDLPDPESYDLVYIDTPYYSKEKGSTDYYLFYHFLEGLIIYLEEGPERWDELIDHGRKPKPLKHGTALERKNAAWTREDEMRKNFDRLFKKFRECTLVVSYNSEGVPSESEMMDALSKYKEDVTVKRREYQYALSPNKVDELLFIGI